MKKILYCLLSIALSVVFVIGNANVSYAVDGPTVNNLKYQFSNYAKDSITGKETVSVMFMWTAQNTSGNGNGTIDFNSANPKGITDPSPSKGSCSPNGTDGQCVQFDKLVLNYKYDYTVYSLDNSNNKSLIKQGYNGGTITTSAPGSIIPVPGTYSFTLVPSPTSGTVAKGHTISYTLTLSNIGNTDDTVNLSVSTTSIPAGWGASLSPTSFPNFKVNQSTGNTATLTLTPNVNNLTQLSSAKIQIDSVNGKFSGNSSGIDANIDDPPSAPANLTASALSTTSIHLAWTASTDTDGTGVAGYEIYNADTNTLIASTSSLTYDHTGLTPSTKYNYKVRAYDTNTDPKNYSDFSSPASASTLDDQPPTVPLNLSASAASSSEIDLTWTASTDTDGTGVAGYEIWRNDNTSTAYKTTTATSYNDTGLPASTTYSYKARAYDTANKYSAFTDLKSATTNAPPADSTSPTVSITAPADGATVSGSVNISADASDPTSPSGHPTSGLRGVTFYADNVKLGAEDTTSPYSVSWDTTSVANGSRVIKATATDNAGNTTSATITVSVSNQQSSQNQQNSSNQNSSNQNSSNQSGKSESSSSSVSQENKGSQDDKNVAEKPVQQLVEAIVYIKGAVKYPDGSLAADALVGAWSENDDKKQARTDASGAYSLQVSKNARWHVKAGKLLSNVGYESNTVTFDMAVNSVSQIELNLERLEKPLPQPVSIREYATQEAKAELSNGVRVDVPAAAVAAANSIALSITPTIEAPEEKAAQVVGIAYDITLKDESNTAVHVLDKPMDITFPYDDATLAALKVNANQIQPAYYDDTTNQWVKLTSFTIDTVNKVVVAHVNHLTRFALIAAADITPPEAPTNIRVVREKEDIAISWVNPTSDFRHAKIYRSAESGKMGEVIFPEIVGTTATDSEVGSKATYYYTVRAVDPAGNESVNTTQVSIASVGRVVSSVRKFMKLGSSGDEVSLLQQILIKEGVYPEALVTGYFGKLTEKAVNKFQEKYGDTILKPFSLSAGNGFVGPKTLSKVLELKAKYAL